MSTVNENQPTTSTTATDLASYQQFALEQQAQNNAWSAEQAQKQMDFQREMSNSAHQREVNDLKAAGLNPILSVNSGASVPNGAAGDTDTSAAGNVGAILQQVLQAQSAREVAGMYNAATLAAASIAANASMYGSDMSYWNTEDHPKTAEEVAARLALAASGTEDHSPSSGNTGPHSTIPGQNSGQNGSSYASTQNNMYGKASSINKYHNIVELFKPSNAVYSFYQKAKMNNRFLKSMNVRARAKFLEFLQKRGFKNFNSAMNSGFSNFWKLYSQFIRQSGSTGHSGKF